MLEKLQGAQKMTTEHPKITNELLAQSARKYIESASRDGLCELLHYIGQSLEDKHNIIGFWAVYCKRNKDNHTGDTMYFNNSGKTVGEMHLLIGFLEAMKFTFLKELETEDDEYDN